MGHFSSKVDTKTIEEIENCALLLLIRLKEDEFKIDQHLKYQISQALHVYCKLINQGYINGCISKKKTELMKNLIHRAQTKLEGLPTFKYLDGNLYTGSKSLNEIRDWVFHIEKQFKADKITKEQFKYYLDVSTECSLKMMRSSNVYLTDEEKNGLCVLLLNLYVNCPRNKITTLLKENIKYFNYTNAQFNLINLENINVFNIQTIRKELQNLKCEMEALNQISTQAIRQIDALLSKDYRTTAKTKSKLKFPDTFSENDNSYKYANLGLKKVSEDLSDYTAVVDTFCPPAGEDAIAQVSSKITYLENFLSKIEINSSQMVEEKQRLSNKCQVLKTRLDNIDETNKKITENLKTIKKIEDRIAVLMESNSKFDEKKEVLCSFVHVLFEIDLTDSEVRYQNTELKNKIEGFLILETSNFLRQIYKNVLHYQKYADQFSFPTKMQIYDIKLKEIDSLLEPLSVLSHTNYFFQERRKILKKLVKEAYETLQKKAKGNDDIFAALERLEDIKRRIAETATASKLPSTYNLTKLNKCRQELFNVQILNQRISAKKTEIFTFLHDVENNVYAQVFSEDVQKFKKALDECEKNEVCPDIYQKIHEITSSWEQIRLKFYGDHSVDFLSDTVKMVIHFLKTSQKENKNMDSAEETLNQIEQKVTNLQNSNLLLAKQREYLKQYNENLKEIKDTCKKTEILDKLINLELSINIELSKINLAIEASERLQQLKDKTKNFSRPIDTDVFSDTVSHIFTLKEDIEDMPEGDKKLDTEKSKFLQEIYHMLHFLDEQVAKFASTRKPTANILELQNHFQDFDISALNISRNSTEFVLLVRQRAESFEAQVKYYLGAGNTVDFYVIHENLVRLLEQLDYVVCGDHDELLKITVDTMEYIKRLIKELNMNVTNE